MRAARFRVSAYLIGRALGLPSGARILSVHYSRATVLGTGDIAHPAEADVVVEDWSLPEADEPHDVTPVITDHYRTWDWQVEGVEPVTADGPHVGGDPVATHSPSKEAWDLRHDLIVKTLERNRYRIVRLLTETEEPKLGDPDEYEEAMWSNITSEVLKSIGMEHPGKIR